MVNNHRWLSKGLKPPLPQYKDYLDSRGVNSLSKVNFSSWESTFVSDCPKFIAYFGERGERLKSHLIIPIYSPRGNIIGLEARLVLPDGSKKVTQYRSLEAQWNPYLLGSESAFKSLSEGYDLWIVEGVFDKIALDRIIPQGDSVVASLRAGMDTLSITMIERYYRPSSTIYICYDNDETGRKKASWLHFEFKKRNIRSVVSRYRGKDPNEVWQKGGDGLLSLTF